MSLDAPAGWTPSLTPAQFRTERLYLAGTLTGAVAYGVHATLYMTTMCLLWQRGEQRRRRWMVYITAAFLVSSIANGGIFKFAQMVFIDDREYPGGPGAYLVEQSTASINVASQVAGIMNCWLQDGLLVYRVWVIFDRSYVAAAIPMLVYLGLLGESFALVILMTRFSQTLYEELAQHFVIAHFSIAVGFNILVTGAIVSKLLLMRRRIRGALAGSSPYLSISAMLVESAALYSTFGAAFLVSMALQSPAQNLILPVLGQVAAIAPLLIILRVAQGRAWTPQTSTSDSRAARRSSHAKNTSSVTRYESDAVALPPTSMKQGDGLSFGEEDLDLRWDDGLRGASKARTIP